MCFACLSLTSRFALSFFPWWLQMLSPCRSSRKLYWMASSCLLLAPLLLDARTIHGIGVLRSLATAMPFTQLWLRADVLRSRRLQGRRDTAGIAVVLGSAQEPRVTKRGLHAVSLDGARVKRRARTATTNSHFLATKQCKKTCSVQRNVVVPKDRG